MKYVCLSREPGNRAGNGKSGHREMGNREMGNGEKGWRSRRECLTRIVSNVIRLNEHIGQGAWGIGKQDSEADENA